MAYTHVYPNTPLGMTLSRTLPHHDPTAPPTTWTLPTANTTLWCSEGVELDQGLTRAFPSSCRPKAPAFSADFLVPFDQPSVAQASSSPGLSCQRPPAQQNWTTHNTVTAQPCISWPWSRPWNKVLGNVRKCKLVVKLRKIMLLLIYSFTFVSAFMQWM